jgi:NAD(P)H-dependent flavin oxidoreductase YrpB (nitropropane dioxygenase family)
MLNIKPVIISGKEVLPIIEGGKGIGVSNGKTSGSFAEANAVGTFSGVNADRYDENGNIKPVIYKTKTRKERHLELIEMGIEGAVTQARIAHEVSKGNGCIHVNVLWEMGGAEKILHGILSKTQGLVHGITCGAGMPYKISQIAEKYNVYYYPIVSSMRAFRALWKRSYHKTSQLLGGVVYEDPWLAGGHNGLSNSEDPTQPENPMPRVKLLRKYMNEIGLQETPIIMAGGVWWLKEWSEWLDNPEIGKIAFQFGTRPILTQESPVSNEWKQKLLQLQAGDVYLNQFSPTGFYSSAVRNDFIEELKTRNERQIEFSSVATDQKPCALAIGSRGREVFVTEEDLHKAQKWIAEGFAEAMRTPDKSLIFVTKEKSQEILEDQINCMGCLSACKFSNWAQDESQNFSTGKKADPRSFCIQKTLQDIIRGSDINNQLMFSGHNAYRFANDPFYQKGFVPTVKQLVARMMTGE